MSLTLPLFLLYIFFVLRNILTVSKYILNQQFNILRKSTAVSEKKIAKTFEETSFGFILYGESSNRRFQCFADSCKKSKAYFFKFLWNIYFVDTYFDLSRGSLVKDRTNQFSFSIYELFLNFSNTKFMFFFITI